MIDFIETLKLAGMFVGVTLGVYFVRAIIFNTFRNGIAKSDKVFIAILIIVAVIAALIVKYL